MTFGRVALVLVLAVIGSAFAGVLWLVSTIEERIEREVGS